jgi:uncharacterized protein (TIRG00374 family)
MQSSRRIAPSLRGLTDGLAAPSRRWWILGGGLLIAGAGMFAHDEFARMVRAFLRADWRWILVGVGLMLVSLLLRSTALKLIVGAYDDVRPRITDTFSSTSIGLLANVLLPVRLGALLNPYVLFLLLRRRGAHTPFATTFGMTVTEQLFSAAGFVFLSLVFVSVLGVPSWALHTLIVAAVLLVLALGGGVALQRTRRSWGVLATDDVVGGGRWRGVVGWLRRYLPQFVDSQRILKRPLSALTVAGVQSLAWLVQLAAAGAVLHAFHLGGAGWRAAALVLVLTNLIGILPLTPGNVGTFQVAAVAALTAYGVGAGPAMAFALGLQGVQLLVAVLAGVVSLGLQDLTLKDLAGKSCVAARALGQREPAPVRADAPARP